ncbi:MAG TPA: XRE family transcriptional regulator [Thermomicrobiales bacterium]|nr:XRE family transcriptional regulator [Thermomicrobiales bacterium]
MSSARLKQRRAALRANPENARRIEDAIQRVAERHVTYQRALSEIRCARALTQANLAKALEVSQAQVSRIEHQSDLYLSTLESYIQAMGGHLELVAVFDDERVPIALSSLTDPERDPSDPLALAPARAPSAK